MKRNLAVVFILLMSLYLVIISSGETIAQNPIKIGLLDTYSGPPTTYTYDVRDAFKLAIEEINKKGGVRPKDCVYYQRW